jgi:hypothetical protein
MEKHLGSGNGNVKPSELRVTTSAKQLFQIQVYDRLTRRQYCDVGVLVSWLDLEIPTETLSWVDMCISAFNSCHNNFRCHTKISVLQNPSI